MKWNQKWKIPHTALERWTLCFSSYKNCKLKVKPWWAGAPLKKKEGIFCIVYFVRRIFNVRFISMYSVLTISEYKHVYISKNITFLLVFKIVGSLKCIFNAIIPSSTSNVCTVYSTNGNYLFFFDSLLNVDLQYLQY